MLSTSPFDTFTQVESLQELFEKQDGSQNLYYVDTHIPNLLAFPISLTQMLTTHHLYATGALILQDKASCFPAHILNPPPGSHVIDACAAPGNKTTHLAAIMTGSCDMHGKGTITAFERDPRRSEVLAKMVKKAGADGIVQIRRASDFLKSNPITDPHLGYTTHLLLDPSCSGSGITAREQTESSITKFSPLTAATQQLGAPSKKKRKLQNPQVSVELENEEIISSNQEDDVALSTRLTTLSGFQITLLLHALSYPHAKRVTYSTCSIYAQENEHVVVSALLSPIATEHGWTVDSELGMLKGWERRGIVEEVEKKARELMKPGEKIDSSWLKEVATGCVRCEGGDGTGGFFVACFIRKSDAKEVLDGVNLEIQPEAPEEDKEETYEEWQGIEDAVVAEEKASEVSPLTCPVSQKSHNFPNNTHKRTKLLKRKK